MQGDLVRSMDDHYWRSNSDMADHIWDIMADKYDWLYILIVA